MTIIIALVIVLILVSIVGLAYWNFSDRVNREITELLSRAKSGTRIVITEDMLEDLPQPVQKYLDYSGAVGKTIPQTIRLKQLGRIRQDEKSAWMKIEAVEYYSTTPPGFVWKVYMPSKQFPLALGRDAYLAGQGSMLVKMLSLFPLANATGSEIDQGSMMRYLDEMVWFPTAFLGDNITWKAIDDTSAEVTLIHEGKSVSATMHFDPEGKPINFIAKRYRMVGGRYELETWSTPFTGYSEFEGLKLPVRGKGAWNLKEGDLEYVDLEVTELEYDKQDWL